MPVRRTFSGYWDDSQKERKKPRLKGRQWFPLILVLVVFLAFTFLKDYAGDKKADSNQTGGSTASDTVRFHYAVRNEDMFVLAYTDIPRDGGLSQAAMLEQGLRQPPEGLGYLPISQDALIGGVRTYDNVAEIDFTAHPCPDQGSDERLLAIAWTVGGIYKADLVRINANGEKLGEYSVKFTE